MTRLTAVEELNLFRQLRATGSRKASDTLAAHFLSYAQAMAVRAAHRTTDLDPDDIQSLAGMVLSITLRTFKPETRNRFSAYLRRAIYRQVKRHRDKMQKEQGCLVPIHLSDYAHEAVGSRRSLVTGAWIPLHVPAKLDGLHLRLLKQELLNPARRHLSNRERRLIKLRYFDRWTLRRIAKSWRVSYQTVANWEQKALVKLRQILAPDVGLSDV